MRPLPWDNRRRSRWIRLAGCAGAVAAVWLLVLPLVGRQSGVRNYIHGNQLRGIDPSAKFYTELPAMPHWYDQVQSAQRRSEKRMP